VKRSNEPAPADRLKVSRARTFHANRIVCCSPNERSQTIWKWFCERAEISTWTQQIGWPCVQQSLWLESGDCFFFVVVGFFEWICFDLVYGSFSILSVYMQNRCGSRDTIIMFVRGSILHHWICIETSYDLSASGQRKGSLPTRKDSKEVQSIR